MFKWVINFFQNQSESSLQVGSRVSHPKYGRGVVMAGSIHIKYDEAPLKNIQMGQPNNKTVCHNLSENKLNVLS